VGTIVLAVLTLAVHSQGAALVDFEQYPEGPIATSFTDEDTGIEFHSILGSLQFGLMVDHVDRNLFLPTGNYLSSGVSYGDSLILVGGDWAQLKVVLPELASSITAEVWTSNAQPGVPFPVTLQAFGADDAPVAPPVSISISAQWAGTTMSLDFSQPLIRSFTIIPDSSLGAIYDNIGYDAVPEPSLALLSIVTLLAQRRRRARLLLAAAG
jgi:hypothetical protein